MDERFNERDRRERYDDRRGRGSSDDEWHAGRDSGGPGGYRRGDDPDHRDDRRRRDDQGGGYDLGRFSTDEGSEYGGNSYGGTSYGRGGDYERGGYGQIGSYGDRDAWNDQRDRSPVRGREDFGGYGADPDRDRSDRRGGYGNPGRDDRRDERRDDRRDDSRGGWRSWYDPSRPSSHAGYGEGRLDGRMSPGAYIDEPNRPAYGGGSDYGRGSFGSQYGPGGGWGAARDDRFGPAGHDQDRWRGGRRDSEGGYGDRRYDDPQRSGRRSPERRDDRSRGEDHGRWNDERGGYDDRGRH